MATSLNITSGFYESKSLPLSHQQCTNWYVNTLQAPGLSEENLFGTPGTTQLATSGVMQQQNRGARVKNDIPYFVNGNSLYRLDIVDSGDTETFALTTLGTVEGSGQVSLADNGSQLMILVPGGKGYIYNEDAGTPFQEITDTDFTANGNPQIVVFIDGYFLCTTDSKKFIVSALNDGLSWDALDFSSAESDPDIIVAPVVVRNQVFIAGSQTTEGFQNIGGSGFPFVRNNVFLDKGCSAPFSIVNSNQTFFMIGAGKDESPAIWQFTGNAFQKISTVPIDNVLGSASSEDIAESFGFAYAQDGAYFVGWTVGENTFVYDQVTKRWHERSSFEVVREITTRWRVNSLVTAYGRVLVGDAVDGRVGELSLDTYTEYDNNIIRILTAQPFANGGTEVRVPQLELTMEAGVGDEDTVDPVVGLSISKDAKTFGYERVRKIGRVGEFFRRTFWRKNGRMPRFVVLRFRLSDPVKPVIIKLEAS